MSFDNLKLGKKLMLPLIVSGLVIVGVSIFATMQLSSITTAADDMIVHRDAATAKMSRGTRSLVTAQSFVYVAMMSEDTSSAGKLAVDGFTKALDASLALFDDCAKLIPEDAATIAAFQTRIKAVTPALTQAYKIGLATPAVSQGDNLKPNDLRELAKGAKILDEVTPQIVALVADVTDFNDAMLAKNAERVNELHQSTSAALWLILGGGLFGAIVAGLLTFWISTSKVAVPLSSLSAAMRRLAGGDVEIEVVGTKRGDEVGDMAKALQVFKDNAIEKIRLEQVAEETRHAAEAERSRAEAMKAEESRQLADVVAHVAGGLDMLSKGKLTHRIQGAFPSEYERLRGDFNAAIGKLQQTLGVVSQNTSAIRSGSREISTAADDLSRRTEQQAANLEETSAAIGQIIGAVRKTATGAKEARDFVLKAEAQAKTSDAVVQRAVGAMNEINASSGKIAQIISVIDEIAFQTNLLALNAGVEAARAGEAGRGFAVVASEVRALAQRSAEAAREIKTLIQESSTRVGQGVDLVGQTGQALAQILKSIKDISGIVQEIAQSATEQSSSLDEIGTAIKQMDLFTQQNAAMVEESTAASKGLAGESDELVRLISAFEVGEDRNGGGRAERRRAA